MCLHILLTSVNTYGRLLTHVIKISVRQFQLEASKYLDKLPLTLTVYGKPVAIVNTFSESVDTITPENHESVIQTSTTPTNIEPEIDDYGWCQVHFEKGVDYLLK